MLVSFVRSGPDGSGYLLIQGTPGLLTRPLRITSCPSGGPEGLGYRYPHKAEENADSHHTTTRPHSLRQVESCVVKGTTHALIGTTAALGLMVALSASPQATLLIVGGAAAASKMPDLDTKWPLKYFVEHRGPTHSPIAGLLIVALGVVCAETWPVWGLVGPGVALGYALHLAADACTPDGLPAWPLKGDHDHRVHLLPDPLQVPTGSGREALVGLATTIGFVLLMYMQAGAIAQAYG